MSISETFANQHVKEWIDGWNNHDIQKVLSLYSDTVEFTSPKIKVVFPDRTSSKVSNKKELEEYWSKALKDNFPTLKFTPKEVMIQDNKIFLEYYATLDGKHRTLVLEKFEFQDGLITKSNVYYGADEII